MNISSHIPSLSLDIDSEDMLYSTYLPLTNHGALFVTTDELLPLESEVLLNLRIDIPAADISVNEQISAAVCWINFSSAKNRRKGMALRFTEKKADAINKSILNVIGYKLNSTQPTLLF